METKILRITDPQTDSAKIMEAALLLDSGGLVAFPTETVYGIGCRVAGDSLRKLDQVKARGPGKHYTLHIADKNSVARYVPTITLRVQTLIRRAWPGPLTLVFVLNDEEAAIQKDRLEREVFDNLYADHSIGIRCPNHPVASALLRLVQRPIVAPSANESGHKPAVNTEEVLATFSGRIDLILDGGSTNYRTSSTVARIDKSGITVLRRGAYSQDGIQELSTVHFLFVCTGNTCRSPMAEAMFKKALSEKSKCQVDRLEEAGYKVRSAGTMDLSGYGPSPEAAKTCAVRGMNISQHKSRQLGKRLIEGSDLIYCMTEDHCKQVKAFSPEAADRCLMLSAEHGIPDPIGQSQQVFDDCATTIENAVQKRISELVL